MGTYKQGRPSRVRRRRAMQKVLGESAVRQPSWLGFWQTSHLYGKCSNVLFVWWWHAIEGEKIIFFSIFLFLFVNLKKNSHTSYTFSFCPLFFFLPLFFSVLTASRHMFMRSKRRQRRAKRWACMTCSPCCQIQSVRDGIGVCLHGFTRHQN